MDLKPLIYDFQVQNRNDTPVLYLKVCTGSVDNIKPGLVCFFPMFESAGLTYHPEAMQIHKFNLLQMSGLFDSAGCPWREHCLADHHYESTFKRRMGTPGTNPAAFDEKRMTRIQAEAVSKSSDPGNIYIAKVENIAQNIQAAFVDIAKGVSCFLPLEEAKNAVFTKKNGKKDLCIGDELLVEVTREKQKNKPASVSANLNFSGNT